jgi:DNA-binding response OmpR family regulator
MLTGLDGVEVCRRLRAARPGMAILMLTARQSLDDKVRGLSEGADDYMTKPFAARELLARVAALGRRHLGEKDAERIAVGDVEFDLSILSIRSPSGEVSLSAREAGILRALYRNRERAVSRAELLETVWGSRPDLVTRAVDMAIATLRKKLPVPVIETVVGVGYRWVDT